MNPRAYEIVESVRRCRLCEATLPLPPRPLLQYGHRARILIAGQAPGRRAAMSGVPFDDPSGDRLRDWMGVSKEQFYDPDLIAILPMAFCYPGTGANGDMPPRPECAPAWREPLLRGLSALRLTLVIGAHAQNWHLSARGRNLTETVAAWRTYGDEVFPLPHPSPRNNRWMSRNPWFSSELLPKLKHAVHQALIHRAD